MRDYLHAQFHLVKSLPINGNLEHGSKIKFIQDLLSLLQRLHQFWDKPGIFLWMHPNDLLWVFAANFKTDHLVEIKRYWQVYENYTVMFDLEML